MKHHIFLCVVKTAFINLLFMVAGCTASAPTPTPAGEGFSTVDTSRVPSTPTPVLLTQTPSVTPILIPTLTLTSAPSVQLIATETPIAIPTPPNDEISEQVLWLLETNNGCQLPCWWGITPGQTEWSIAEVFLNRFDPYIFGSSWGLPSAPGLLYYEPSIPLPPEINAGRHINPWILVRDGIVEKMEIDVSIGNTPPGYLTQYTLSAILITYGEPTELWMATHRSFSLGDAGERLLPFIVVLFYSDQGIATLYYDNGTTQNDMVRGCPQGDPVTTLALWSSKLNLTFEEAIRYLAAFNVDYLSLEESTEMDVATFYETFKNPNNTTCLETPTSLWP